MTLNKKILSEQTLSFYNHYRYMDLDLSEFPFSRYAICNTPHQGSFYIDQMEFIKNVLLAGEVWEPHIVEILQHYVKKNSIALDIGAHIGIHTIAMSNLVGKEGVVLAFEPQRKIHKELIMNCNLNKVSNVLPFYCAVGEYRGISYLGRELPENEGMRYISLTHPVEPISMLMLDELSLDNVSLIKIDAENYEKEVLEGAYQTILRNQPTILIEIGGGILKEREEGIDEKEHLQSVIALLEDTFHYTTIAVGRKDYLAIPCLFKKLEKEPTSPYQNGHIPLKAPPAKSGGNSSDN